jgi:RNA polymerase sigma-70 factor, ECF subfamily
MTESFDSSVPDDLLVRSIRRNRSARAFGVLYDRHTPRASQTAWRILGGDDHEAEDAIQEAWTRALASLQSWSGESAFGAWFRGIAAHVAIDMVRRRARFSFDAGADTMIDEVSSEQIDLETAITGLPPGYRAVLVLHDIEGFTHEEIAERLGITAGTSKGQLFKARRAVRARLATRIEGRA